MVMSDWLTNYLHDDNCRVTAKTKRSLLDYSLTTSCVKGI